MQPEFKPYEQYQGMLFPPNLDDLIEEKALVRVVNTVVDQLATDVLEAPFKGGGRPAFHPRMMLKVLVYAYCSRVYSSRRVAQALRTDIHFMWLSGWQHPDFRTINRFRSDYFKTVLPQVFSAVAQFLLTEGYIRSTDYFVDGTKLTADANKHSAVWKKNTVRFKAKVQERARAILKQVERVNRDEDRELGEADLPERGASTELSGTQIREVVEELNQTLNAAPQPDQTLKQCARQLEKEARQLEKYEQQEDLLDGRNSYSKTDPDATFMRMKDDELRAGYNVQIGTQDGFITGCTVHQNANDGSTLPDHLRQREQLPAPEIKSLVADAGYGCESVYADLERRGIEGYVKYGDFWRDAKDKQPPFHWTRFKQLQDGTGFICPAGRTLALKERIRGNHASGFEFETEVYECDSCADCPFRSECVKKDGKNRTIHYNRRLQEQRRVAYKKLTSERGIELRKQRGCACESPFGDLKHNQRVRRFCLRGLVKVTLEMLLHAIGHNLRKVFGQQLAKIA